MAVSKPLVRLVRALRFDLRCVGARIITLDHPLDPVTSRTSLIARCEVQGDWGFAVGLVHIRRDDADERAVGDAADGDCW